MSSPLNSKKLTYLLTICAVQTGKKLVDRLEIYGYIPDYSDRLVLNSTLVESHLHPLAAEL